MLYSTLFLNLCISYYALDFFEVQKTFLKLSFPCLAMETHRVQQALTVDALRTLHNSLKSCPTEETVVSDPKGLLVQLMPHQKRALAWLLWRESEKPSGGILGWYDFTIIHVSKGSLYMSVYIKT